MRSASTRLGVFESLYSAQQGVGNTWARITTPSRYVRYGLMLGGGVLASQMLGRLFGAGKRPVAVAAEPPALRPGVGRSLLYLAVQLASVVALPWLRSRVHGTDWGGLYKRMQPSYLFFRWLGLEK